MPLPADHFAPEMPLPHRAYLNALWDRLEKELRGTWPTFALVTRPTPPHLLPSLRIGARF